ncbi:hypothetical protein A4U61_26745 [Streptomyces sp. H-KF8]|uniref:hypothetical protein n=1 Tax=Streptomyces sp. H-KF8 TaxID=1727216 RepID=UPI0007ED8635|nr:hypothetical protein [Streptomyces sp. H-KF8]OBQ48664.1 hypothetical protein A4U61_26745 [Streptomyces sp. H-KF8]
MALVVALQPGARWPLRTAPVIVDVHGRTDHTERDDHFIHLGKREAVGLSASGLLPPAEVRPPRGSRKVEARKGTFHELSVWTGPGTTMSIRTRRPVATVRHLILTYRRRSLAPAP